MNKRDLPKSVREGFVLFDGGTGTVLSTRGLSAGERPETWNLKRPDEIRALHEGYFSAGANIVKTNTFGANGLHYDGEELSRIVSAGVRIAVEARDAADLRDGGKKERFVALDIGPLGVLLKPYGTLEFERAVEYFSEIVRIGASAAANNILSAIEGKEIKYF